jgi:5,5'-dehydrodivanillate O-demethylase oxygenase subunit
MITAEQNQRLTRVGAGTPMGNLMRRYWHPIAATAQLETNPVKPIRVLGEDLVLFRDTSGGLGLVENRCAHRMVKLEYGYPVENGLRCPYHGWTYDGSGACVSQPAEPDGSTYKNKVWIRHYPVQELAGLIFAYLGPAPAPLLPRWQPMVMENVARVLYFTDMPCNWLQAMENSPDLTHIEWLHGHFAQYHLLRTGHSKDSLLFQNTLPYLRHHADYAFDRDKHGMLRRRLFEGQAHDDEGWTLGNPIMLPNINLTSNTGPMLLVWRVPVDDTHTTQWNMSGFRVSADAEPQTEIPCVEVPLKDEKGNWNLHVLTVQDVMAFVAQDEIMDRTRERLGAADQGIILYRQMLEEQMELVERGKEPINVFRDENKNQMIELPIFNPATSLTSGDGTYRKGSATHTFGIPDSAIAQQLEKLVQQAVEAKR